MRGAAAIRALASLSVASVLAGCGPGAQQDVTVLDAEELPFDLSSPTPPDATGTGGDASQVFYLVADGRLVPVERRVPDGSGPGSTVRDLQEGPTEQEREQGLSSAVTAELGLDVLSSRAAEAVVRISSPDADDEPSRNDDVLAVAQVVLTLTARLDLSSVQFVDEDGPVDVPRADGSLSSGPLVAEDFAELVGPRPG